MNKIIKNYNVLIKKFQKIESDSSENEIHDKRVILRRIFPILTAFKINPSKVKNGKKAFKLFGKLRDIHVQLLKLESIDQTPEIMDYHAFLKQVETELKTKVSRFCKKKDLEFPIIKKKSTLKMTKFFIKTEKSLNKLIERIKSRSIDEAEDIHKIRIEFKKFRYKVEVLSYIVDIEESKLDMLKMYQDKLGEIQDYEVLINGIKKYCKKLNLDELEMIDQFEHDQDTLIVNFDNQIELFTTVCKDVLILNREVAKSDETLNNLDTSKLVEEKPDVVSNSESSREDQVRNILDYLVINAGKIDENSEPKVTIDTEIVDNEAKVVMIKDKANEVNNSYPSKVNEPKVNKKRIIDKPVPLDTEQVE
jgi:CHAD domain-containing protein